MATLENGDGADVDHVKVPYWMVPTDKNARKYPVAVARGQY